MVLKADRERVKALLTETITLLCKNGLNYQSEFAIEALIGITLDRDDVFLVSIKETICSDLDKGYDLHDDRRDDRREFPVEMSTTIQWKLSHEFTLTQTSRRQAYTLNMTRIFS